MMFMMKRYRTLKKNPTVPIFDMFGSRRKKAGIGKLGLACHAEKNQLERAGNICQLKLVGNADLKKSKVLFHN